MGIRRSSGVLAIALVMVVGALTFAAAPEGSPPGTQRAPQWTPRGATDVWTISWSDPPSARVYGITIENPDEPLVGVRLAQSTLHDAAGHTIGVARLQLLDRADATTPPRSLDVPANSTRTVFVRLEAGVSREYGTFEGVLRLTAAGSSAMKDVPLKIQASSTPRRAWGVVLTLLGLLVTFALTALLKPQLARMQARRAAAAMRGGIERFLTELDRVVPPEVSVDATKTVAKRLAEGISDAELTRLQLLPSGFALAPGFDLTPDVTAGLQAKLDDVSKVLEGLFVLLRVGFPPVIRKLKVRPVEAGLLAKELDFYAERVTGPQDARTKAEDVRTRADALGGAEAGALRAQPMESVAVRDLDFQIRTLSLAGWFIWAAIALAIAVGWIFSDPDFGTVTDLVTSLTWGFGMTTFGAGLQGLQPNTVATQMTVKVPK